MGQDNLLRERGSGYTKMKVSIGPICTFFPHYADGQLAAQGNACSGE